MPRSANTPFRIQIGKLLLVLTAWLAVAAPTFGFIWGEPLPLLPPTTNNNPPPNEPTPLPEPTDLLPPIGVATGGVEPPLPPASGGGIPTAPEPATIVSGLLGAGVLGVMALRRRRTGT